MDKVKCECGAVYREKEHKLIVRDRDSAKCRLCGEILKEWNGAVMYSYDLVSEPEAVQDEE